MDGTDLNNALQQIGMLSEPAAVQKDEPRRKGPKVVAAPKPARQITAFTTTAPQTRLSKGKHRKPKIKPPQHVKNPNAPSSDEGSDEEYFYPPLKPKKEEVAESDDESSSYDEDNGSEGDNNEQFDEYELQLALHLSKMDPDSDGDLAEQCKYRANIFTRQHVLVQLDEDKGTQRPNTEGHVWEILTTKDYHPRGIKVRLMSGDIGRVQSIFASSDTTNSKSTKNSAPAHIDNNATPNAKKITTTTQNIPEIAECPVGCGRKMKVDEMDMHVDECLTQQYIAANS